MSAWPSRLAAINLIVWLPAMVEAVTPESCIGELSSASTQSEYRLAVIDLGSGFVMDARSLQGNPHHQDAIFFTHCATGGIVSAFTDHTTSVVGSAAYQLSASIMREAITSTSSYSFEDVAEQLRIAGLISDSVDGENSESCGCAAYYPEQRGTKMPWIPQ